MIISSPFVIRDAHGLSELCLEGVITPKDHLVFMAFASAVNSENCFIGEDRREVVAQWGIGTRRMNTSLKRLESADLFRCGRSGLRPDIKFADMLNPRYVALASHPNPDELINLYESFKAPRRRVQLELVAS